MSDRIVIDPDGLRRMAARMRGAALLLSSTRRELASRSLPAMPSAVAALVAESLARVNAEVQDLAAGLVRDAGHLLARATWAEIGGGGPAAWPSHDAGGSSVDTVTAAAPTHVSSLSDEQVTRAEGWAIERVDTAEVALSDDDASALRRIVAEHFSGAHDDVRPAPLGDLTLTGSDAPVDDGSVAGPVPSPEAGGGALGNAFTEVASTPAGAGILGCLAVGMGTAAAEWSAGDGS